MESRLFGSMSTYMQHLRAPAKRVSLDPLNVNSNFWSYRISHFTSQRTQVPTVLFVTLHGLLVMDKPGIIDLTSSPPVPKEIRGGSFGTPPKKKDNAWDTPSSSPLPSPREVLRGLLQPNVRTQTKSIVEKGFKTARELLAKEEERKKLLFGGEEGDREGRNSKKSELPAGSTSINSTIRGKYVKKPRTAKAEKDVKRPVTVSSHFSKKGKTATVNNTSKNSSTVDQSYSEEATITQKSKSPVEPSNPTQSSLKTGTGAFEGRYFPEVPARRRDWTPVRNTVPVVEIESSPVVGKDEYEARFDTVQLEPEQAEIKAFGDTIRLLKYECNSSSASSTQTFVGSTLGTTKRPIHVFEKPQSTRSMATFPKRKQEPKKSRKKIQKVTSIAAAQYHVEDGENSGKEASVLDLMNKTEPKTSADRKQNRRQKTNSKSIPKPNERPRRRKQVSKKEETKEVEEVSKLLSPQSAIKKLNEQLVLFGTYSQLIDGKDTTPPNFETSLPQKSSNLETQINAQDSSLDSLMKTSNHQNDYPLEDELGSLGEFLHAEFDCKDVIKIKNRLKQSGLWEAAAENNSTLKKPDILDLSHSPQINSGLDILLSQKETNKKKGRKRTNEEVATLVKTSSSPTPALRAKRARSVTPVPDELQKQKVTPRKSKTKRLSPRGLERDTSLESSDPGLSQTEGANQKKRRKRTIEEVATPTKSVKPLSPTQAPRARRARSVTSASDESQKKKVTLHKSKTKRLSPRRLEENIPPEPQNVSSDSELSQASTKPRKINQRKLANITSGTGPAMVKRNKRPSPTTSRSKKRAKSPLSSPSPRRYRSRSISAHRLPTSSSSHTNESVYEAISKAIMAEYESTGDIANSWHYKILTYEPVILEDLTIWLNTVGFGRIGMDDEISPETVKEWAEARSIVNVWRASRRGRERKRF